MAAQQHADPASPSSPTPSIASNIPDKKKAAMLIEYFERTSKDNGPSVTVRINPKSRTRANSSLTYETELVQQASPLDPPSQVKSISGDGELKLAQYHSPPEADRKSIENDFVPKEEEKPLLTQIGPEILDQIITAAIERMVLPELRLLREERAILSNNHGNKERSNFETSYTDVNDIASETKGFATPEDTNFYQENDIDTNRDDSVAVRRSRNRHSRGFVHSQWSPESTPPPHAKWSGASRHSSKDVQAIMNHLVTQDAERNARDEQILRTISQLSAEIKNGIDELKVTISEEEQDTVKQIERKINILSASDYPRPLGPRPMLPLTIDPEEKRTLYDRIFGQGKHKRRALDRIERLCLEVAYDVRKIEQKMGKVNPSINDLDASENDFTKSSHHDILSRDEENLLLDEESVKRHWDKLIKSIHGGDDYDEANETPLRTPQTHFNSPQPPDSMPLSERRIWQDSFQPVSSEHNKSTTSLPPHNFPSGPNHQNTSPEGGRFAPNRNTRLKTPPVIHRIPPQPIHSPKPSINSTGPPTPPSKSPLKNNIHRVNHAKPDLPSRKPCRMNEEYLADDDDNASSPVSEGSKNRKPFRKRFSKMTSEFMSEALAAFKVQKGEPKKVELPGSDEDWESEIDRYRKEDRGQRMGDERERSKRRMNRTKRLEKHKANDVVEEIIYDEPEVQAPLFESFVERDEYDTNFTPQPYENINVHKDKATKILRKKTSEKVPHLNEALILLEAQNNIVSNTYATSQADDVFVSTEVPLPRSTTRLQKTSASKSSRKPSGPRPLSVASKRGHTERSFDDQDLPPPQPAEQDSKSWNAMFPGARLRPQTKNSVEI